jgi:ABC-type transporter Mla subunit MlaD
VTLDQAMQSDLEFDTTVDRNLRLAVFLPVHLDSKDATMTNEEMQSTIQFIVEQQAQFMVNLQHLQETVVRVEGSLEKLGESQGKFGESLESLHRLVGTVLEAQATTEVNLARTEVNLARTDERLNNLINVVERYISDHSNGHS